MAQAVTLAALIDLLRTRIPSFSSKGRDGGPSSAFLVIFSECRLWCQPLAPPSAGGSVLSSGCADDTINNKGAAAFPALGGSPIGRLTFARVFC